MDINERAKEEWTTRTDGFERIATTLERTREPKSASEIADQALVSEKTARKHLDRLVDLGRGSAVQDGRTTRYRRDPDTYITARINELRRDHSREELIDGLQRIRDDIDTFRRRHGVDSAEELSVRLEPGADEGWIDLSEWRTKERRLALVQVAISFDRAADSVEA